MKSVLTAKLNGLTYRYGKEARAYFEGHSTCEACGEGRLATLNVHHIRGKQHKVFKTLCFNCHAVAHYGAKTYADFMREKEEKWGVVAMRDRKIRSLYQKEYATRTIAKLVGVSHVTVWKVIVRTKGKG